MPLKTASVTRVFSVAVVACFLVALLWLIAAFQLFFNPPRVAPQRTDAIVVLGGLSKERLPVAQELQDQLDIPVLVVSTTGLAGNAEGDELCREDVGDPDLLCFRPSPLNTRGEASALNKLIQEHGWKSITVVTSDYHLIRAGTLIHQCTPIEVEMVGSQPELSAAAWLDRFVVETGGLIDALVRPECSS
ncbi:YdcF family protein [Paenarthrobacter sp. NPDC056912]|uniref:YdcF family protein n=1 Tax=Paenarthrobacter sp. NPDC056912 TaxID=3345965 RepID=UPI0036724139